jgi:hypothetical protein
MYGEHHMNVSFREVYISKPSLIPAGRTKTVEIELLKLWEMGRPSSVLPYAGI